MPIRARALHIPLTVRHRQASSDRTLGDAVWVVAERDGVRGVGEGAPRPYVTGEDVVGALTFIETVADEADAQPDVDALRDHVQRHRARLDRHPAAWCAVETALLDRMGRASGRSIEALLGLPDAPAAPLAYTAVLSDLPLDQSRRLLAMAVAAGIVDYKLKLGGDLDTDRARLALVHDAVPAARVRLDANNLWGHDVDAALAHLTALGRPFDAVEEPLAARRPDDLARIARELGCAIVLDESLANDADLGRYDPAAARWIANLKVSKVGGLLRGLPLARAARAAGFGIVVGAHVGETSVLTRLGQLLAREAGPALHAMEGAAGLLQLAFEPVRPVLHLGAGGRVDTSGLGPTGHGLTPVDGWGD